MPNDKDRAKVSLDNDVTPGYYQGLKGLKTGRDVPRTPVRGTRRAAILADHGIIDQGAADPNQGQLFNTRQYEGTRDPSVNAPRPEVNVRPNREKPQDLPLGAAPGFMPGLDKKQKVRAINNMGAEMGTDTPMRDAMANRQAIRSDKPANWYSGVTAAGRHDVNVPGEANIAIGRAAQRQGVPTEQMTRTTAVVSPQNKWDTYHPSNQGYVQNNIALAENVTKNTYALDDPSDESIKDMGLQSVQESPGGGGTPEMAAKAGRIIRDDGPNVSKPLEVKSKTSQKVPNFEASLHLTSSDPHVQRGATEAFTVDTHDAKLVGVGNDKYLSSVGAYEAVAMTGSRTALRNRELAPNEQARQWVGQRGGTSHNEEEGFFKTERGKIKVRPEAAAVTATSPSRATQRKAPERYSDEDLFG